MKQAVLSKKNVGITISLIIFFAFIFILPFSLDLVYFQENDDFLMMMILSGTLYGTPSSDIYFLAKPLSLLISTLYRFNSNFSWYTALLMATQSLALFGYLWLVVKNSLFLQYRQKFVYYFLAAVPFFVALKMFFSLQFTQAAILTAGIGTILVILSQHKWEMSFGYLLIVLGFFWRFESAILAISFILIIYAFYLRKCKYSWRQQIVNIKSMLLLLTIGFCFLINFLGSNQNSPFLSQDYREALKFHKSVDQIQGYNPTGTITQQLIDRSKQAGYTKNSVRLMTETFYHANTNVFTLEKNQKLLDTISYKSLGSKNYLTALNLNKIIKDAYLIQVFLFLSYLSLIILLYGKDLLLNLVFYFGLFILFLFLILSVGRLPERVFFPFMFIAMITPLFILQKDSFVRGKLVKVRRSHSFFLALLLIVITTFSLNVYNDYNEVKGEQWWKSVKSDRVLGIERVLSFSPDLPIIAFSSFYTKLMKTLSPVTPPDQVDKIWQSIIPISWAIRSPAMDEKIKNLNLDEDLFLSVALGDAVIATSNHLHEIDLMNRYYRQIYRLEVQWAASPYIYDDTGLGIWKIESYETVDKQK